MPKTILRDAGSIVLAPLGLLYAAGIKIRNAFYRRGIFKSTDFKVPTISVGNITVGGTGKTPLVAHIAEILAGRSEKVCILSRGYKREDEKKRVVVSDAKKILAGAAQAGDEPFELAEKLLGKAMVIADANRRAAGKWAIEKFGITAFVLDDAFQHLKVARDLDIVCVDATNPFGNEKLLPQGILREPLKNLARADAVVITRANLIKNVSNLKAQISRLNPNAKIFVSRNKLNATFSILHSSTTAAFCALGNPENFFAQLKQEGVQVGFQKSFPDHHFYTQKDVEELEKEARASGAEYLVTTKKDAVKLADLKFEIPVIVAESRLVFDDEVSFRQLILSQIRREKSI